MKPKAVIFDLDNTLFHWEPPNAKALAAAHELLGRDVDVSFERFMELHDAARRHSKAQLAGQGSSHNRVIFFKWMVEQLTGQPRPGLVLQMFDCYWRTFLEHMQPHPDAHRVLTTLHERYPLALLSNHTTRVQLEKVRRLAFEQYFGVIVTSEEAGVEKPDPRIFQLALGRLGVRAHEAVFIGDRAIGDIDGAAAVGVATIHTVELTGAAPCPLATHVVKKLADVLTLLA